jgi:hypothetical protein
LLGNSFKVGLLGEEICACQTGVFRSIFHLANQCPQQFFRILGFFDQ